MLLVPGSRGLLQLLTMPQQEAFLFGFRYVMRASVIKWQLACTNENLQMS